MKDQLPLPDENALVIPASWRRGIHPRHGGVPGPKAKVDPGAGGTVRALVEENRAAIDSLLAGRHGNLDLTEAARRHLGGDPDPAGAATVVAVVVMATGGWGSREKIRAFFDSWVTAHGIGFAVCALVELSRARGVRAPDGDWNGTWVGVEYRDDRLWVGGEILQHARALLAAADDDAYRQAEEGLAGHRDATLQRWAVSYLVPARQDWMDECCDDPSVPSGAQSAAWLPYCSMGKADQLTTVKVGFPWHDCSRGLLVTLTEGIGPGVLPFFVGALDQGRLPSDIRKLLFEMIAVLPTDEAFQAIVDRLGDKHARPALLAAMKRFPVRALRLLAAAAPTSPEAASLLAEHVTANAEVVAAALPDLPDGVRAAIGPLASSSAQVPAAPAEAVPGALTALPWERPLRPVVDGLQPPSPEATWNELEREDWLGIDMSWSVKPPEDPHWEALVEEFRTGARGPGTLQLMLYGPEELVRPLLADWDGRPLPNDRVRMRLLVARYGLDAIPLTLRTAKERSWCCGPSLLPFRHAEVAHLMAGWLTRSDEDGDTAHKWFDRHGLAAVPLLVPAMLGKAAGRRRGAERALRHLSSRHDLGEIVETARASHGDEAASAVESVLNAHPVQTGLVQPPKVGDWLDPALLPQVLLRGRGLALPAEAVRRLAALLALPFPYRMEEIRRSCDPESLAEFGWALFQRWRDSGAPSKDGWALTQLGRTGDDETVRRLAPVIRAWPGEGGHKYAVTGLDVLAAIGSEVALMHLHGISQKVRFKGLQNEAQTKIRQVADRLGLSTEQLADRLVPDFGLDAAGSLVLDYGPRRFVVGFDEQLMPFAADEDGTRRKSLPKPGAKDDPQLATAAHKRFTGLKKDVRTVAADQIRRLESAMVTGRRWTPAEFGDFIVGHPLMWHLARRLVWVSEDGGTATAFRIAEDRTFADVEDEAFTLPDSASVGIAHPVHLGDALDAWSQVFADYAIAQPFPQLTRAVHTLTDRERGSGRLERFEGLKVPFGKVLGLVGLGWDRGEPQDAGIERWISWRIAHDRYVVIGLDPGISVGAVSATGDHQTLEHVSLVTWPGDYWSCTDTPLSFGELDPVIVSEILADLTTLADAAA